MYDCIIVGAGPAGLSAALVIGRCRRKVLVRSWPAAQCRVARDARIHHAGLHALPARLGCEFTDKDCVPVGRHQVAKTPGLYVAGDAAVDVQLVIVAAAEGTKAAIDINAALTAEDLGIEEKFTASAG